MDPVETSFLTLEMMCRGGFKTSKNGLYKPPGKKRIKREYLLTENI